MVMDDSKLVPICPTNWTERQGLDIVFKAFLPYAFCQRGKLNSFLKVFSVAEFAPFWDNWMFCLVLKTCSMLLFHRNAILAWEQKPILVTMNLLTSKLSKE